MNESKPMADSHWSELFRRGRLFGALLLAVVFAFLATGQSRGAMPAEIPPGAGFVEPLDGSTVQGIQSVIVAAPEYSLYYAEFGVDGGRWQPLQDQGDGTFAAKWNSGHVPNGKHTLTARFSLGPGKLPVYTTSIRVYVENIDG